MNLLLVTVDCLRADRVGFAGYERPTTPYLDRLAQDGLVFRSAIVAGTPTYFSFPAMMAARYPLALGRGVVGLSRGERVLASLLREAGYDTGAVIGGNPYLDRKTNYHLGFDSFDNLPATRSSADSKAAGTGTPEVGLRRRLNLRLEEAAKRWAWTRRLYRDLYLRYGCWTTIRRWSGDLQELRRYSSAERVADRALAWLEARQSRPWFLWLHFMDAHHPYFPPDEALARIGRRDLCGGAPSVRLNSVWNMADANPLQLAQVRDDIAALYDAGVDSVDGQIRRLVTALESNGDWSDTLFVLTADHGEEFLENGHRYHYPAHLGQHVIRVPLLLHGPGIEAGLFREPFSLIDLGPLILAVLGVRRPDDFGRELAWQNGRLHEDPERIALTETVKDCRNPWQREQRHGARLIAAQDRSQKIVADLQRSELTRFALTENGTETRTDRQDRPDPRSRRLAQAIHSHLEGGAEDRKVAARLSAEVQALVPKLAEDPP